MLLLFRLVANFLSSFGFFKALFKASFTAFFIASEVIVAPAIASTLVALFSTILFIMPSAFS